MKPIAGRIVPASAKANPSVALLDLAMAVERVVVTMITERRVRAGIDADLQRDLARIQANQQLLLHYLDSAFDERHEVISGSFAAMDTALAAGNTEVVLAALDGVVKLAQINPMSDLVDRASVTDRLLAGDATWQI